MGGMFIPRRTAVTQSQARNSVLSGGAACLTGAGSTVTLAASDAVPVVASWADGFAAGRGTKDIIRKITGNLQASVGVTDGKVAITLDLTGGVGSPLLVCRQRAFYAEGDTPPVSSTLALLTAEHTGGTSPTGTAIGRVSENTGYEAWRAFQSVNPFAYPVYGTYSAMTAPFIEYAFATPVTVTKYRLNVAYLSAYYRNYWASGWTLYGWNGAAWVALDVRAAQTPPVQGAESTLYTVTTPGSYSRYLLRAQTVWNNGNHTGSGQMATFFGKIEYFGTKTTQAPADYYSLTDGKVYEGTTQVWRVYIGQATVVAGAITAVTQYAFQGLAQPAWQRLVAGSSLDFTHNIGVVPHDVQVEVRDPTSGLVLPATALSANYQTSGYGVGITGKTETTVTISAAKDGLAPAPGSGNPVLLAADVRPYPCRRGW